MDHISQAIALLLNKTMEHGEIPEEPKQANVSPFFKKGQKHLAENYRPISLTSIVCKLMETFVKRQIMAHLIDLDLLSSKQFDFISYLKISALMITSWTQRKNKSYQSVLNCQKGERVHLMHNGNNHWIMTGCSNVRVQVCDSLRSRLSCVTKRCIKKLYQTSVVSLLPVQKKRDGWNCGLFSVAFAAEILGGTSPMEANLGVDRMRV